MKVEKVEGHLFFSECTVRLDYYIGVTKVIMQGKLIAVSYTLRTY